MSFLTKCSTAVFLNLWKWEVLINSQSTSCMAGAAFILIHVSITSPGCVQSPCTSTGEVQEGSYYYALAEKPAFDGLVRYSAPSTALLQHDSFNRALLWLYDTSSPITAYSQRRSAEDTPTTTSWRVAREYIIILCMQYSSCVRTYVCMCVQHIATATYARALQVTVVHTHSGKHTAWLDSFCARSSAWTPTQAAFTTLTTSIRVSSTL